MEGPLYGETTKAQKIVMYAVGIAFALFTVAAVIVCLIFAILDKHWGHFVLVLAILLLVLTSVFMFKWYRAEHIHPKFKWIIVLLVVVLVFCDVSGFVYSIAYRIPEMPNCTYGFYNFNTSQCTTIPEGKLPTCGGTNCLFFGSDGEGCCGNCSWGSYFQCVNHTTH